MVSDWNDILCKEDRRTKNKNIKINNILIDLKKKLNLIDPWKIKNRDKQQYTWKRKNSNTEASRIDYFLISKELFQRIITADIRPAMIQYTDHMAVALILDIKIINRGPGYWI